MTNSLSISAELTYVRLRGLMPYFMQTAKRYGLPLALLLAVASRESRMGLALSSDGTGDRGNGIGIMQIDKRHHPEFTSRHSSFDHEANIDYGGQFLAKILQDFSGNTTHAVAAYNAGAGKVRTAVLANLSPDTVTTGGDYASDVLSRKQLISGLMGLSKATSITALAIPLGLIALATYNYVITPNP